MSGPPPDGPGRAPGALAKALAINLDPLRYGTFVEIGAGQEVARHFFQAGGAAGTVAKTMSAYDMAVSDAVYGPAPGGRYVSRGRLEAMLVHEYDLLTERLGPSRGADSAFFVYAATVAAQSYARRAECHGWIGVRAQHAPGAPPSDAILHVRMLDADPRAQHEALGILGVNLLAGVFNHAGAPEELVAVLSDDLKDSAGRGSDRIEVDLVDLAGPAFGPLDLRLLNLHLIRAWLTRAVMFDATGRVVPPGEALRRRDVLLVRSNFRPVTRRHADMLRCGLAALAADAAPPAGANTVLPVAEITMATLLEGGSAAQDQDFLDRVDTLSALGVAVLVSDYLRYFRLRAFLRRYTAGRLGIVVREGNLRDILDPEFYTDLEGGVLEAFGRLFPDNTWMYVYPGAGADGQPRPLDAFVPPPGVRHLYAHLRDGGRIVPLPGADPAVLDIDWRGVLPALRADAPGWAEQVPEPVAQIIRARRLFGFAGATEARYPALD